MHVWGLEVLVGDCRQLNWAVRQLNWACARAQHFITDYEKNKSFSGFPALGIEWQRMESPFLRKALGMKV